jgi:Peptidase M50B-like
LWSVLVTGAALLAVSWWLPDTAQALVAYLVTWFLLLAAPRPVLELQAARRRGRARDSDADQLARLTGVPGIVWIGMFLLVTLGSLVVSALVLVPGLTG